MNQNPAILLHRLGAGFFLALFLIIHVVKSAHQHESVQSISKEHAAGPEVSKQADCPICDYHIAKDSSLSTEISQAQKIEPPLSSYSFYNTPFVTSIGSTSSGRGPPSVV